MLKIEELKELVEKYEFLERFMELSESVDIKLGLQNLNKALILSPIITSSIIEDIRRGIRKELNKVRIMIRKAARELH